MLTLSDELKLPFNLNAAYENTNVGYSLYLNGRLIYKGQVYFIGASHIYYKDIIEPYLTDYKWFTQLGHTEGYYDFRVRIAFDDGTEVESEVIRNVTEIPTVQLMHIPSIIPKHPTEEFKFGWLCPTATTKISTSNSTSDVISGLSYSTTGHTMIAGTSLPNSDALYRLSNQAHKIAEYDTHDSRFYLSWITRNNEFMCRPFCKRSDLQENITTSNIYTINNTKKVSSKASVYTWKLNSDWLTYDEHNVYESLMVSPVVYLYDSVTGKTYRVNVIDAEWTEKNSNNNKRPFNMTVNVEMADENKITY